MSLSSLSTIQISDNEIPNLSLLFDRDRGLGSEKHFQSCYGTYLVHESKRTKVVRRTMASLDKQATNRLHTIFTAQISGLLGIDIFDYFSADN